MTKTTIKVKGVSKAIKNLRADFKKELKVRKQVVLKGFLQDLREETPVDTGRARDGWYITKYDIRNDVEYVSMLNNGTSKRPGTHFIEKAVLKNSKVKPSGIIVRTK